MKANRCCLQKRAIDEYEVEYVSNYATGFDSGN